MKTLHICHKSLRISLWKYNIEHVENDWNRALSQAKTDTEDAITATRAMGESMLKWILGDIGEDYKETDNLSQLYKKVAQLLNLSPDQHGAEILKVNTEIIH